MFSEEKNIRDINPNSQNLLKDRRFNLSYTKTGKLITALYMVTDILDKDEPIRQKLRQSGTDILSDIIHISNTRSIIEFPSKTAIKIHEILTLLNMSFTVGLMSEMNHNVLKKEFLELKKSLESSFLSHTPYEGHISISDYLSTPSNEEFKVNLIEAKAPEHRVSFKGHSIGHQIVKSIGVQKGSTLMNALSDRIDKSYRTENTSKKEKFETSKKERRFKIVRSLSDSKDGMTITDIKNHINDSRLFSSEKMLQRELVDMVKDGVLNKTGLKRWSRYTLLKK